MKRYLAIIFCLIESICFGQTRTAPPSKGALDKSVSTLPISGGKNYKPNQIATTSYATPEMFGAKGDGITSDNAAINAAIVSNRNVVFSKKTYAITGAIIIHQGANINFNGATIKKKAGTAVFDMINVSGLDTVHLSNLIIDGNKDADGLVGTSVSSRFGGLVISGVRNGLFENITVTGTVNNELTAGIFIYKSSYCSLNNINGYKNDRTAILLDSSNHITINGSVTYDNLGSGISSIYSPYCNYLNIQTHDNGYSNLSVNGIGCKIINATSYNSNFSGINIGHIGQPTDGTIIQKVVSYNNRYEGITISASKSVQIDGATVYGNHRNSIRVFQGASAAKFNNVISRNSNGGQGILIQGGFNYSIDNSAFSSNYASGIYADSGISISIGANVKCYNNGKTSSVNSAGILLNKVVNSTLNMPVCYDTQAVKTQESGVWVIGGNNNKVISPKKVNNNLNFQVRQSGSPVKLITKYQK